jgi:hypothetical protein
MLYFFRTLLSLFLIAISTPIVFAQNEGLIYGEIVLKDKTSIVGAIRWSGGQLLWSDILLVSKTNSYILNYLSKAQREDLNSRDEESGLDWEFTNLFKDKLPERQNEILCRFGDISSVHVTGASQAQIYLKSGSKIRVVTAQSENRHMGKDVAVYDGKLRKIKWDQISRVNFRNSPENFNPFKGKLLYGTVSTSAGELTGFIQWDKLKFLSTQKLQGKIGDNTENSEYRFDLIHSIIKKEKGAIVKFKSDKSVFLHRNGDVNLSNRGIVVMHPVWGRAVVEWEAFHSVRFLTVPHDFGYQRYTKPKRIYATVRTTDGKIYKGNCTFDLDEDWNIELFEGSSGNVHFQIPFHQVSKVAPVNPGQAKVILKNKKTLTLDGHNDVTEKNWGVIVWLADSKYQYIPWNKVGEVNFR